MGLAIGMTACFLIFLYVRFELSYDQFNKKADQIYRLVIDVKNSGETASGYQTAAPMASALKSEFPEVQAVTRVIPANLLVIKGNFKFQEEHSLWADSSLFDIFDFPLKYGNPHTALKEPNSIVFSETAAHKYFGSSNPVGQSLLLTGLKLPAIVTGVMKDIPGNSHIKADMLVSMSTFTGSFQPNIEGDWSSLIYYSYVLLKPGINPQKLQAQFPSFIQKYASSELKKAHESYALFLEPLKDIYLRSKRGAPEHGDLNNVYIFSVIALFLLLIACVNFINLTTARSVERAKEVGIRKVAGAAKFQLIWQFLVESSIISFIAFLFAFFLCYLSIPLFNQLSGKIISQGIFEYKSDIPFLFLLSFGIGLLAGLYPAFVLSAFKPISVLKGRFASGNKGIFLRKVLVIIQFSTSIALIVGTIVIYTQINFMHTQPLGFDKNQLLVLDNNGDRNIPAFKQQLAEIPSIESSSISSSIPGRDYNNNIIDKTDIENNRGEIQEVDLNSYNVDYDFLDVFKIKLIAGRNFSKEYLTDSIHAMILNNTAVKNLGYASPQKIIGKRFNADGTQGTVIGVIDDFHYHSLKEAVQPLSLRMGLNYWDFITLKVNAKNLPATLAVLKNKWDRIIPNRPFMYFFLDENFDKQYSADQKFGRLFLYFALLAILISSLGLLALASYSTLQRTKEIGIRKVLGASVIGIVNLLSKDFLKLVLIAAIIAFPVAWYTMNKWLQNFAYKINISWWVFAIAGMLAILISLITISFQAIKAAIANPVKSLRTE